MQGEDGRRGRVEERGEGGTGGADGERRAAARRTEKSGSLTARDRLNLRALVLSENEELGEEEEAEQF